MDKNISIYGWEIEIYSHKKFNFFVNHQNFYIQILFIKMSKTLKNIHFNHLKPKKL